MRYIKGFDALRAISITLVLTSHLGLFLILPENTFIRERLWLLISGTTGVQIFFTISGFLITSILLKEKERNGTIHFRNFYIRRFLRLMPPLLVFYPIIAILMQSGQITATSEGLLLSIFYLYNFVPRECYTTELGHTWSLALEEQYYLIWPFFVRYFQRINTYSIVIFTILIACIACFFILPRTSFQHTYYVSRWFIPAVAPILVGSYAAFINQKRPNLSTRFRSNKRVLIYSFILFVFPLYAVGDMRACYTIVQAAGISLWLLWIFHNQESRLTQLLDNRFVNYIGKISYGLYVYQGLFLTTGPGGKLWIQQFPQNILLTFALAIVSFHFLEKPILKLKQRF